MDVGPKSLILDLLSTLKGGAMPVRALVQAGAVFGIEQNSMRVALARLLGAGLVERDERGQYRPGAGAAALHRQVTGWRTIEERVRRWQGGWIGVLAAGNTRRSRPEGVRRARALRVLGFRSLAPGLEVRPDNLAGDLADLRTQLYALGLEHSALVVAMSELDRETEARARALWDVAGLRAGYRSASRALARSERRLSGLPTRSAMVESFVLGGRVIRQLVFDPLLPEPMVPASERQALVAAMRRYDRAGRACWAEFLHQFGVLHDRTPADVRIADAPRGLVGLAGGASA